MRVPCSILAVLAVSCTPALVAAPAPEASPPSIRATLADPTWGWAEHVPGWHRASRSTIQRSADAIAGPIAPALPIHFTEEPGRDELIESFRPWRAWSRPARGFFDDNDPRVSPKKPKCDFESC